MSNMDVFSQHKQPVLAGSNSTVQFTRPATRRPRRTPSSPPPRHLAPGQSTPRTPPCRCSSRRRSIRPRRSCCRGSSRGRPGRDCLGNLAWAGSSSHCRSRTRSGSRRGYRTSVRGRSRPSSSCTGRTCWPASAGSARACRSPSCRPGSGSRIVGLRTAPSQPRNNTASASQACARSTPSPTPPSHPTLPHHAQGVTEGLVNQLRHRACAPPASGMYEAVVGNTSLQQTQQSSQTAAETPVTVRRAHPLL